MWRVSRPRCCRGRRFAQENCRPAHRSRCRSRLLLAPSPVITATTSCARSKVMIARRSWSSSTVRSLTTITVSNTLRCRADGVCARRQLADVRQWVHRETSSRSWPTLCARPGPPTPRIRDLHGYYAIYKLLVMTLANARRVWHSNSVQWIAPASASAPQERFPQ